jgi:peroxiredoxin Q/BCP
MKNFNLPDKDGNMHSLKDYKGKWVILYFYPRDNTSGCTKEAIGFSELKNEFEKLNSVIIGISKDSPKSHSKFIEKHNLNILLLCDETHEVMKSFEVWGKKKLYGREYEGTIRSTFLINPAGKIVKEWRKVKVTGHVEEVLNELKSHM